MIAATITTTPLRDFLLGLIGDAIEWRAPVTDGCPDCRDALADRCDDHGADAATTARYTALETAITTARTDEDIIAAIQGAQTRGTR